MARSSKKTKAPSATPSASALIDQRIRDLADWRGATLARMRALILEALPDAIEEVKWRGVPVWSRHGILCTGESYKDYVKLTFAKGAKTPDPRRLFNASLEGNARRAIDIGQGETVDAAAFKALIRAAAALNVPKSEAAPKAAPKPSPKASPGPNPAPRPRTKATVKLLAGGNPQIAKADGAAPVAAYIAALSGWKRALCERLDALIVRVVPAVQKAVKWNSPFYGLEGRGWFLSFHTFTKYVKVAFFKGAALRPPPPGASKSPDTRYLDLHETDPFDEVRIASWIGQAAALPGWMA